MDNTTKYLISNCKSKLRSFMVPAFNRMVDTHSNKIWFADMLRDYSKVLDENKELIAPLTFMGRWQEEHSDDILSGNYQTSLKIEKQEVNDKYEETIEVSVTEPEVLGETEEPAAIHADLALSEDITVEEKVKVSELLKAEKELRQEHNKYSQFSNNKNFNNYQMNKYKK